MIPIAAALLPQVPALIAELVALWKKSNPEVSLEEWLAPLAEGPTFEERKRAAALRLGVPYVPVVEEPKLPRRANARDIVDAAISGVVPEWFSIEEKVAVAKIIGIS
jgi:hypothetical protein